MSAPVEIPGELLTEIHMLLAQMSGFVSGVANAIPEMKDTADPLVKRADGAANRLRDYTARTIIAEHLSSARQ